MKSIHKLILLLLITSLFFSCKKDDENEKNPPVVNFSASTTTPAQGQVVTFNDLTTNSPTNWSWSFSPNTVTYTGGTSSVSQNPQVLFSEGGTYTVSLTASNEAGSNTNTKTGYIVSQATEYDVIRVSTDFGDFMIWLYTNTPQHRQNFLNLANEGFYDSLIFHRVVENFVIQGGDPEGSGYGGPGYNIPAEIVTGLNHVYGAVGAARLPDSINPDRESNGSQFYVVCDPNGEPYLNGNYTVFGIVFHGMAAVDVISHVEVDANDRPVETVYMKSVKVEKYTTAQLLTLFGFTVPQ